MDKPATRIARINLDEPGVLRRSQEIEHERAVAIYDLIENNHFCPNGYEDCGPFYLFLKIESRDRLIINVQDSCEKNLTDIKVSMQAFRRIIRDYFMVCESYYSAIKTATLAQIESLDMGRRGLHNEGSELLRERLADVVDIDFDTARRLFTLICVLHIRA